MSPVKTTTCHNILHSLGGLQVGGWVGLEVGVVEVEVRVGGVEVEVKVGVGR